MTMTAFTGSIKNQARLETLLNRAHALLAENRIESARILMEQALALGGSSELADLCGTLEKVVLPAEAKSALDEADRRRSLGDMDGAEANLHRAAELAPSSLRAGNALGWFLAERDQLAQAQVVFMELARKHHDVAEAHANLAAILIRRGQQDRAEESLWNVLRLEPDHVDAMLALMNSFAGKGEETAALELAKRFLSAAPDHPAAGTVRAFMATRGAAMTAPTNPIPGNPVSEWFAGQQQQAIDSFFALLSDEDSHRDLAISLQRSVDLIHAALKDPRAREAWRMLFSVAKAAQEGGCFAVSRLFCKKILEWEPEYWFARELPRQEDGYYSQLDQDKVIEAFFRRHGPKHRRFVEVGAFDGIHYSNVRRLHEAYGWTGVSIEPVRKNFQRLLDSYAGSGVHCVRAAASRPSKYGLRPKEDY